MHDPHQTRQQVTAMPSLPSSICRLARFSTIAAVALLVAGLAQAQDVLVTLTTVPAGIEFRVDGATFRGPASFTWPKGSTHNLEFVSRGCGAATPTAGIQYDFTCTSRFTGPSWVSNKGALFPTGIVPYTTETDIHSLILTAAREFRVDLVLSGDSQDGVSVPPPTAPLGQRPSGAAPGIACVDGQCFIGSAKLWQAAGDHTLEAYPFEGFAFTGWGINGGASQSFQSTFRLQGPVSLIPFFAPGKRVEVYTEPRELRVLVDRTEIVTIDPKILAFGLRFPVPGYFDWALGSEHVLAAPSPQLDKAGNLVTFDSWMNAAGVPLGGQNTVFKVDLVNVRQTLVAKFIPAVRVSLLAPAGLSLTVDGRENWPSYNFVWGLGTKHTVTAPAEQFDKSGRKYVFKRWSNGGPASQTITIDGTNLPDGIRLSAEYEKLGMLVIRSNPDGMRFRVENDDCQSPCTVHRAAGAVVAVSAPVLTPLAPGTRAEFVSWNDSKEPARSISFGDAPVLLSAEFRYAFLVTAVSDPVESSDLRLDPPSSDGYYAAATRITAYANARPGFRFRRWEGDVSGALSPATLIAGGPRLIRAIYERTPFIAPAGVRNAAGDTPVSGVAPGSIVSIYGASLAPAFLAGSGNPLAQSLAGTSVYAGTRLLPLLFVSPAQINAQLPFDLSIGPMTLTVKNQNLADVDGFFDVVRSAPGLFVSRVGQFDTAVITRVSGPGVTAENPIIAGETINLFGTGFGPHRNPPPEGFSVSEADGYRLTDPVEVLLGDKVLVPEYAGSATGLPGVVVVRFRLPDDLPRGSKLTLRVDGVSTNTVVLPTADIFSAGVDSVTQ
jgi:uncharacterized protein (TIGR03437 family)